MHRAPWKTVLAAGFVLLAVFACGPAFADEETLINLEWRPSAATVYVGQATEFGLYAVVDEGAGLFRALDMVFTWEPACLRLDGLDDTGALLSSGFPLAGDHGLNESNPPQDGDGYYRAFAPLGEAIEVTPEGFLLTTYQFTAVAPTDATLVHVPAVGGTPPLETTVWGGSGANTDVTGRLGSAEIEIVVPEPAGLAIFSFGVLAFHRRRQEPGGRAQGS